MPRIYLYANDNDGQAITRLSGELRQQRPRSVSKLLAAAVHATETCGYDAVHAALEALARLSDTPIRDREIPAGSAAAVTATQSPET